MINITVNGKAAAYDDGVTYGQVAKDFADTCKYDISLLSEAESFLS